MLTLYLNILSSYFAIFHQKIWFYHFLNFFSLGSVKFLKRILGNKSETKIGDKKLSVELHHGIIEVHKPP